MPLAAFRCVICLALPVSLHPVMLLLPGAALLGLATNIAAGSFNKVLLTAGNVAYRASRPALSCGRKYPAAEYLYS